MSGADTPLSFERYDPRWPYAQPTTAVTEVVRTLAGFGAEARSALPELERLAAQRDRYAASVLAELRSACDAIRSAEPRSHDDHGCCHAPAPEAAPDAPGELELEEQDGRRTSFAGFFAGKPAVVAFLYTRCDNPYKCPLTVTRLARLQELLDERDLTGEVRLAAITYDPEFDIPMRLKRYGSDLGIRFGDDVRFFRTPSRFGELSRRFGLRVNHGPSTVNRHQIEAYVLDADGAVATSFTRLQWQPEAVLAAVQLVA